MKFARSLIFGSLVLAVLLVAPSVARGADINEVTTGFTKDNKYDFRLKVNYDAIFKRTALNREYMGNAAGIDVVKDLVFNQVTHRLNLRAEFALYRDFGIYIALPLILSQKAKYSFAKGDRYHGYTGERECQDAHPTNRWVCNPDGVNANNSRFVQDGLATGLSGFSYQRHPDDGGTNLTADEPVSNIHHVGIPTAYDTMNGAGGPRTLFEGPQRSGLDQLYLGIHGLIFSQKRHASFPDWRFGVEFRLAVGKVKDFTRDPAGDTSCGAATANNWNCRPELNKAVGRGVHEIRFFTTASKFTKLWKGGGIDSFIHIYFQMPMGYTGSSFYANKYDMSGDFGEESQSPLMKAPMEGGIYLGGEFILFTDKVKGHKISIELTGMIEGYFEGKNYTEAYELLAGAPALNLYCPSDPLEQNQSYQQFCNSPRTRDRLFYYPGVSISENFVRLGVRLGVHAQITKYAKLSIVYQLSHEQEHFLTTDDAGVDNGRNDADHTAGVIDVATNELNPWHRPVINQAGHRIRAQETMIHKLSVGLKLMF